MPIYRILASAVQARINCIKNSDSRWAGKHAERICEIVDNHLPSGSGFDGGTKIDWEKSSGDRLVFDVSFHHMNEHGMYTHWTEHEVIVTASLVYGIHIRVTGVNHNDIKDHIEETFHTALTSEIEAAKAEG